MERSYECNGANRISINVTAWQLERKAEVFRVNRNGLSWFHLPVHYGYQLQNLASIHKNSYSTPPGRPHQS